MAVKESFKDDQIVYKVKNFRAVVLIKADAVLNWAGSSQN